MAEDDAKGWQRTPTDHELRRNGQTLAKHAEVLDDHEGRIATLESVPAPPVALERPKTPREAFRTVAPILPPRPSPERDARIEADRMRSEVAVERGQLLDAFNAWTERQRMVDGARDRAAAATAAGLALVARELGVEDRLPETLRNSLRPPPPGPSSSTAPSSSRRPAIPEVRRRTRQTNAAALLSLAILLAEALPRLLDFLNRIGAPRP